MLNIYIYIPFDESMWWKNNCFLELELRGENQPAYGKSKYPLPKKCEGYCKFRNVYPQKILLNARNYFFSGMSKTITLITLINTLDLLYPFP